MNQTIAATLFCLSPIITGGYALSQLRPTPARPAPDRQLVVAPRTASTAAVAARHAGHAAIALDRIHGALRFDRLPFETILLDGAVDIDLAAQGFVPTDSGGTQWRRPHRWSLLEGWSSWRVTVRRGEEPKTCGQRALDGGYDCGGGLRFIPAVRGVGPEQWGVVQVTTAPAGARAELRAAAPSSLLAGQLMAATDQPVTLHLARNDGSAPITTRCAFVCPLEVPAGRGDLVVVIEGPNPPLAFELHTGRETDTNPKKKQGQQ